VREEESRTPKGVEIANVLGKPKSFKEKFEELDKS